MFPVNKKNVSLNNLSVVNIVDLKHLLTLFQTLSLPGSIWRHKFNVVNL